MGVKTNALPQLSRSPPLMPPLPSCASHSSTATKYSPGQQHNVIHIANPQDRDLYDTKFNIPIFTHAPFSSLDKNSVTQWHSMTTVLQTYHWNSDRLSHWESKQSVSGSELLVKADPFGPLVGQHMVQSLHTVGTREGLNQTTGDFYLTQNSTSQSSEMLLSQAWTKTQWLNHTQWLLFFKHITETVTGYRIGRASSRCLVQNCLWKQTLSAP